MTKRLRTLLWSLGIGVLAAAGWPATAAPIVQDGSTYFFRTFGDGFGGITLNNVVFDNQVQQFDIEGRHLTISEIQDDLGGGAWRIVLTLTSDVDMAPGDFVFARFGHNGDPLDLLAPVRLESIIETFSGFDATGAGFSDSFDAIGFLDAANRDPWIGQFGNPPNTGAGFTGLTGLDLRSITFDMRVTAVPEPASLLLAAVAIAALCAVRRRAAKH